jgi:hypothetical protein
MAEQEATANRIKEVLDYQNGSLLEPAREHLNEWKIVPANAEYQSLLVEIQTKMQQ